MRHHHFHPKLRTVSLATGLAMVALGALFLLQNAGLFPVGFAFRIWPAVLLVLAARSFARRGFLSFGGHALVLGAAALQLKELGMTDWLHRGWPVALIWLGALKVAQVFWRRSHVSARTSCHDACERLS